jgi:hypothetical protein
VKILQLFLLLRLLAANALAATPSLLFLPDQEVFPALAVGATGPARTVTVRLSQTGTLTLTGVTASPGFSAQLGCGSDLPPEILCPIAVTFVPQAPGLQQGNIAVSYTSSAAATQTKAVCGTGLPAGGDFAIGFVFDCTLAGRPSITLAVYPNAFNGTVNLSCTNPAALPCSVNPTSVTLAGSTPVNFTVSATTSAKSFHPLFSNPAGELVLAGLAGIVVLGRGKRRAAPRLLVLGLIAVIVACGGNSTHQPMSSSVITITAAGSNGTTHQSTFDLNPQ